MKRSITLWSLCAFVYTIPTVSNGDSSYLYTPMNYSVFAAGYQCILSNRVFVGVGISTDSQADALDNAKVDCERSLDFYKYNPRLSQHPNNAPSAHQLETAKGRVDFGSSWYCATTGYPFSNGGYNTGAVGYGTTQDEAKNEMVGNFLKKHNLNDPKLVIDSTVYCEQVGASELMAINLLHALQKPLLGSDLKKNKNAEGYKISLVGLENQGYVHIGSKMKYTCLANKNWESCDGEYEEVPDGGGCNITTSSASISGVGVYLTKPLLGTKRCIQIKAQRMHTINGDGIDDKHPNAFILSDSLDISGLVSISPPPAPPPTPIKTPKVPQIKIISYNPKDKVKSGHISDVEAGVNYSCVVMSAVDGHKIPIDNNDYKPEKCTLVINQDGTGDFQVPDSFNEQWFAIKAVSGDTGGVTSFSNAIFLKDPAENHCTYAVKNYSEVEGKDSEIGTHCFKIPTSCEAPTANEIVKTEFRDNTVYIYFTSKRTSATSITIYNDRGNPIKKLKTAQFYFYGNTLYNAIDPIEDLSSPYYDYKIYNVCENNNISASYCPVRIYHNTQKPSLICDPKAEVPENL